MKKLILLTVVAVAVGMGGFVMGLRINGLALPDAVHLYRHSPRRWALLHLSLLRLL